MLARLRALWSGSPQVAAREAMAAPAPEEIEVDGLPTFQVREHLREVDGYPALDWDAVHAWAAASGDDSLANRGWTACERAWLEHLGVRLGSHYGVRETETAMLLSSLSPGQAKATLDFMGRTPERIVRILDGVAEMQPWGKDMLIVFDDAEAYYPYVSRGYPEAGEYGFSSGMYIREGCAYFVTMKADLHAIEPVIAHEMTHGCLSHLPIPAWLNEGLAVNTERRLVPPPRPTITPQQMHRLHVKFWTDAHIQEFWSGKSFLRSDDGQMLSYEMATVLVDQLSRDWPRFRSFALEASLDDSGAAASLRHFDLDLGAAVCAIVEREPERAWSPDPPRWADSPERGAFA